MIKDFPETFDLFWKKISGYEPRKFMQREASFKKSAEIYTHYYFGI